MGASRRPPRDHASSSRPKLSLGVSAPDGGHPGRSRIRAMVTHRAAMATAYLSMEGQPANNMSGRWRRSCSSFTQPGQPCRSQNAAGSTPRA